MSRLVVFTAIIFAIIMFVGCSKSSGANDIDILMNDENTPADKDITGSDLKPSDNDSASKDDAVTGDADKDTNGGKTDSDEPATDNATADSTPDVDVTVAEGNIVIDHTSTDTSKIPSEWITAAKSNLKIAYQHTSHGSQLISGMNALMNHSAFGSTYMWGASGLALADNGIPGAATDLSTGDSEDANGDTPWAIQTRTLLDNAANNSINVIMWSWCSINGHNAQRYLDNMEKLIAEYGPGGTKPRAAAHPVTFVFFTGHAEGLGEETAVNSIHYNNQLIRKHCSDHKRLLFDFADIEAHDPDGVYYWDKFMYDNLNYTDNGTKNWAVTWIGKHPASELTVLTTETAECAHSDSSAGPAEARLNCVLKSRAAWWMFARIAGWNGQ